MTTRRLVLLRHAKAEHPDGMPDHDRPLALAGRRQCGRVGAALAAEGVTPDLVWCSSSVRTRQTWDLVRQAAGLEPPVRYLDDVYEAGVRSLIALLATAPDEVGTLVVVGHEPTMSHAAATIAGPGSDEGAVARVQVGVPTASWSWLELDGPWAGVAPRTGRLLRLVTPD
ncbi:histidine phosphatase family protein [Cellulomonas sp. DKR-3]|uniref:Histidine phosphatase family protein n=1 Tax=Cellulomonas fulva TaxID=2835530 RepID=A0ABS5U1L6_9CELL|nr:histidine phosphatase family protein [Cellulomonas fulva]MBT0995289.1 histidine phosphatase family protein [Cellulomonas fulva]